MSEKPFIRFHMAKGWLFYSVVHIFMYAFILNLATFLFNHTLDGGVVILSLILDANHCHIETELCLKIANVSQQ